MTIESLPHDVIALAGDWHGEASYARRAFRHAAKSGARGIIQLGDFGLWPGPSGAAYLDSIGRLARNYDLWFAFVDGNHDDHWQLAQRPVGADGVRVVTAEILHLPRGFRWRWDDVVWMALGGAVSLDRSYRTIGQDWWPTETITAAEAYGAVADGPIDVLLSHDVGARVDVPDLPHASTWERAALDAATAHRRLLDSIARIVTPSWWWHGHMHVHYRRDVTYGGRTCHVTGLNCDGSPLHENVAIVNTRELGLDEMAVRAAP